MKSQTCNFVSSILCLSFTLAGYCVGNKVLCTCRPRLSKAVLPPAKARCLSPSDSSSDGFQSKDNESCSAVSAPGAGRKGLVKDSFPLLQEGIPRAAFQAELPWADPWRKAPQPC